VSHKNCLSCKSYNTHSIYDFGDMPAVNSFYSLENIEEEKSFPMKLNYCSDCWLVQIEKVPSPSELYSEYHHKSSASKGNVDHLISFKNMLVENFSKDAQILEVGSNDSTLLNLLSKEGYQCLGVDPAKNLNEKHENVVSDFFGTNIVSSLKKNYGKFDLIFGLNVFAHNDSFIDMFSAVEELLNQDGDFILDIAYAKETILQGNFDTIYHEHVCSYTLTSLKNALGLAKLDIVNVQELPSQGGSLRVFCKKKSDSFQANSSVEKLLEIEKGLGFETKKFYDELKIEITNKVSKINDFINDNNFKRKILFIGAPARGVVVLNLIKNLAVSECLVLDDTPEKQHKLFPGKHIEVKSWSDKAFDVNNFDFAVILSWNYAEYLFDRIKKLNFNKDTFVLIPTIKKIN